MSANCARPTGCGASGKGALRTPADGLQLSPTETDERSTPGASPSASGHPGKMSGMPSYGKTDTCARCGSSNDVRVAKYVRGGQHLTELWCQPCRRSKLVPRTGKAGREPEATKAIMRIALAALVIGSGAALSMWAFRLLA